MRQQAAERNSPIRFRGTFGLLNCAAQRHTFAADAARILKMLARSFKAFLRCFANRGPPKPEFVISVFQVPYLPRETSWAIGLIRYPLEGFLALFHCFIEGCGIARVQSSVNVTACLFSECMELLSLNLVAADGITNGIQFSLEFVDRIMKLLLLG
jgi:hypothetical protein